MSGRTHTQAQTPATVTLASPAFQSRPFPARIAPELTAAALETPYDTGGQRSYRFGSVGIQASVCQPKLRLGVVVDRYEQEADRVAAQVVSQIHTPGAPCQTDIDDRGRLAPMVQRLALKGGTTVPPEFETTIQQARGGQALAESIRGPMERAFRTDFSAVRIHTDTRSDQLNRSLRARAFTTGPDIFFRSGEYNPGSAAGQQLLAHELTHVVQQHGSTGRNALAGPLQEAGTDRLTCASPRPANTCIQAKFGFEVELDVALGWADQEKADLEKSSYTAPDLHLTTEPIAAQGTGFEIHIDHSKDVIGIVNDSNTIIELVTKPPIDESVDNEQNVRERMQQMTDFVASIDTKTGKLQQRTKLTDIKNVKSLSTKEGYLFVGGEEKGKQQVDNGYMQSTYAIKVAKLPKLFEHISKPEANINPISRKSAELAYDRTINPASFIKHVGIISKGWQKKDEKTYESLWGETAAKEEIIPKTKEGLQPLMGLLALIINYLIVGKFTKKKPDSALAKTHLGLLYYKSRLSSVRNALTGASRWVLEDEDRRLLVIEWLLEQTGGTVDVSAAVQTAFPEGVKVGLWLKAVLEGTGDPLFEASKNAWSDEIAPYNVGKLDAQRSGAVIESRRVAPPQGWTYNEAMEPKEAQNERPVKDWEDIAVALWQFLRTMNDVG